MLRLELYKAGKTQSDAARIIGVSRSTFYRKMKNGRFGTDEAKKLVDALGIKNPAEIFFG